ncbi:HAD family hydrolase [Streptomyces iconiensis]|uniref:HAD-IA family hydrolase n=1 Tax=Streptomyces iconiensis TaxID=1384038 RepID=A0ABT7A3I2_9ACTN|nr:HAD-IA family hydrolase [Streptomyces iconiensis]MDJ1135890.1 HAD-IA family hydrolase [Streptomyces iconiensis]
MQDLTRFPGSTTCVLLDFDGPVCTLFSAYPAAAIARRLERLTAELPSMLPSTRERARTAEDPYVLLQAAFEDPGAVADGAAGALERLLTEEEVTAATGARPTRHADHVIRALHEAGHALAVTTNNSREAVECYLARRGLLDLFEGHVHGRTPGGPLRLKPAPDCLERALEAAGTAARDAVMVGDHPRDLEAARAAGVRFVGYARDRRKAAQLRGASAAEVVRSLPELLRLLDPAAYELAAARLRDDVAGRT